MDIMPANTYTNDIDDEADTLNYKYDKTGNLIEEVSENMQIKWTYYGKVKQIDSTSGAIKLKFKYDASGNRLVKENAKNQYKEIYVRDAQGNVIALYEVRKDSLYAKEFYMYGMQRLGYWEDRVYLGKKAGSKVIGSSIGLPVSPIVQIPNPFLLPGTTTVTPVYFGKKRFELNDWLGNVRVVVNDRKTPVNSGSVTVSYMPQTTSVTDYYSFGSQISERSYSQDRYRFSFNDKEDIEQRWYQDYGARYYHKALSRFISADPLIVQQKKYSWLSSYQFAGNTPVQAIDMDGLEAFFVGGTWQAGDKLGYDAWGRSSRNLISDVLGNNSNYHLYWSGNNNTIARKIDAYKIASEVYRIWSTNGKIESISLIGHSHGGNVMIEVANILRNDYGITIHNLLTVNTPVVPQHQLNADLKGKVKHYNIYNQEDLVQILGGSSITIYDSDDEVERKGSIIKSLYTRGEEEFTGEIGFAGKTFEGAINIKYKHKTGILDGDPLKHMGNWYKNVKEWTNKIKEIKENRKSD